MWLGASNRIKKLSWNERKQHTIKRLRRVPWKQKWDTSLESPSMCFIICAPKNCADEGGPLVEIIPFPTEKIDHNRDLSGLPPAKIFCFPIFYRVPDREFILPGDTEYCGTFTPQAPCNYKKTETEKEPERSRRSDYCRRLSQKLGDAQMNQSHFWDD